MPEFSSRIKKLRDSLHLTQHELAERLHVRPQVVASWEQGRKEPSASSYRELALLASPKDAWFFLEQIGVSRKLVRAKWSDRTPLGVSRSGRPRGPRARSRVIKMRDAKSVQIPLLHDRLPSDLLVLEEKDFESVITLPAKLLPEILGVCVAIRHRGSSLAPILQDQSVAIVDTTRRNPARLSGRMIGLWGDHGPVLRWLAPRNSDGQPALSPAIPPQAVVQWDKAAAQRIIGDVVFWCSRQG